MATFYTTQDSLLNINDSDVELNNTHLLSVDVMYALDLPEDDVKVHLQAALILLRCHLMGGGQVFNERGYTIGPLNLYITSKLEKAVNEPST